MRLVELATRPLRRLWESDEPLDAYALVHLASSAGDALVTIALADSVFFSIPVGQAKVKVALYLLLTMAPLAVAAPLLVPLLDRGGYRRAASFGAAGARMIVAIYAAPRVSSLVLFPAAFALLVLSKVHGITRNGLVVAYAERDGGLVQSNARLGRLAVVGALSAAAPGALALKLGGATSTLYLAVLAYAVTALLTLRLPQPATSRVDGDVGPRGRMPSLAQAATGTAALRGASGFLVLLLAFTLRTGGHPPLWFGILALSAAVGGFLGDVLAPRLSAFLREQAVVLAALMAAGAGAILAIVEFGLPSLALFAALAGMAAELGRLAFQSLMQRSAPGRAHGRVFVRYEIAFQLAWVAGAFVPAVVPMSFRAGIVVMAACYVGFAVSLGFSPRRRARSA